MAEAAVVLVITKIASVLAEEPLKRGFTLLFQEASELRQVRHKLHQIQSELEVFRGFFQDINRRQGGGPDSAAFDAWVDNIRKAAHNVEDVIDEASYLLAKRRGGGLKGFLHKVLHVMPWIDIVQKLQEFESSLDRLSKTKERFSIDVTQRSTGGSTDPEKISKLVAHQARSMQEDEVVGIDKSKATLMNWLVGADEPDQRLITSVWGMGGLGKTTLINQVYKSSEVRSQFHYRAWVSVSQTYQLDDLLRSIFKQLTSPDEKERRMDITSDVSSNVSYVQLAVKLQNFLLDKRYLVIFDDVWDTDVWSSISNALIDNKCRSRVVFTTRNEDVARLATAEKYRMKLQPLQVADARALFCMKASTIRDPSCPPELKECAWKFVDKCGGLPLGIVSLGSMLSLKDQNVEEWERVYRGLSWELNQNRELHRLKNILMLSFRELPYYLRNCLLYCSVFPEDYLIKTKALIRLWVAEGFIEVRRGKTMEEVGGDILNELVHRSMLDVVERDAVGRIKGCRMHDLVRELLMSISQTEKFGMIFELRTARIGLGEIVVQGDARRLCILNNINEDEEGIIRSNNNWHRKQTSRCSQLRSLLVYLYEKPMSLSSLALESGCRLLRVLDLQDGPLQSMRLEGIFELFNLRYLRLTLTRETAPFFADIWRLIHLETLDLRGSDIRRLPSGVMKLERLRHLCLPLTEGVQISSVGRTHHGMMRKWTELQTLSGVYADKGMLQDLYNLTQLVCLRIHGVELAHWRYLCAALSKMNKLVRLEVFSARNGKEYLELDALSLPSPSLFQKLLLSCQFKGESMPTLVGSLNKLTKLTLIRCRLTEDQDPLTSLHSLPCLVSLILENDAYIGPRLCFREGWFRKLRSLRLSMMTMIRVVEMEQGTMPSLRLLDITGFFKMKEIPVGIEHLTSLQEWKLERMPEEFIKSLQNEEAEHKLRHIPDIKHSSDKGGGLGWQTEDPRRRIRRGAFFGSN